MLEYQNHPFNNYIPDKARGVIIGSAPPWRFCTGCLCHLYEGDINFFYGSVRNLFWNVMNAVLKPGAITWPRTRQKCKEILRDHNLGIGDILSAFDRRDQGAADADLFNLQFNASLINTILKRNKLEIKYLFFTSKFPYKIFREALTNAGYPFDETNIQTRKFNLKVTYQTSIREFIIIILLSPSRRGGHRPTELVDSYKIDFADFIDPL